MEHRGIAWRRQYLARRLCRVHGTMALSCASPLLLQKAFPSVSPTPRGIWRPNHPNLFHLDFVLNSRQNALCLFCCFVCCVLPAQNCRGRHTPSQARAGRARCEWQEGPCPRTGSDVGEAGAAVPMAVGRLSAAHPQQGRRLGP